jgi:purine-binding chemotaxis protein CheW
MSQPQLVTFMVAGQAFGVPIARVQDAFLPQAITAVPKAPVQVAGVMNLRGRIVTAISLKDCLALPLANASRPPIAIGIEHRGELYGLLVEEMGEVLTPDAAAREENPANLDPKWRFVSACVYRLKDKLLVVLDVDRLLDFRRLAA